MASNIDRFQEDLDRLIKLGDKLAYSMMHECDTPGSLKSIKKAYGDKADDYVSNILVFRNHYQLWYTEAIYVVKQLIPDRLADFVSHYEKPRNRKVLTADTYVVEDYLQGMQSTRGVSTVIASPKDAIARFTQQVEILKSAKSRFTSSLFDIKKIVQADLLDDEISAAEELAKHKFARAAGAVAGVVLERHLSQVCVDHNIKFTKKNTTISDYNDALKSGGIISVPDWRFIQHLGDIRNQCDHSKGADPTIDQANDLISGVKKIIKTIF